MRPRVVCNASAVVALLLDAGPDGRWATNALAGADLAAPSLWAFEAANIVRRQEHAKRITTDQAAQAHADMLDLAIEQWPYELLVPRAMKAFRQGERAGPAVRRPGSPVDHGLSVQDRPARRAGRHPPGPLTSISAGRVRAMVIPFGMTHRVGPKGQVVIPKDLRDRLGISPGDEVELALDEGADAVRLEPVRHHPTLRGSLAGLGLVAALEADHRSETRR